MTEWSSDYKRRKSIGITNRPDVECDLGPARNSCRNSEDDLKYAVYKKEKVTDKQMRVHLDVT